MPISQLAVSPDGKTIAFEMSAGKERGSGIWTVTDQGVDLRLLVRNAEDPAWSPDGSKLTYSARYSEDGKEISKYYEIFIIDPKSGKTSRVTDNGWHDRYPVFSPDGKRIAFQSFRHQLAVSGAEIFVINTDGTGEGRLTLPQNNPKVAENPFKAWATDQSPDWHA
ncbi:MAG: PD40 domain-containing protein [Candidatus Vogelbacteria bacterium]|nr:PD40 domain-containing protein [Candidatus Vogelbacteria bacterium]